MMAGTVARDGSATRLGFIVAVIGLILDQASKSWVLFSLKLTEDGPGLPVGPFADIRLIMNHGISYGLFQQSSDAGRWLLVAISVLAAIGLWIWLLRLNNRIVGLSVGLILSGAIGNAIDRTIYGAVIDFVHLHTADRTFTWYVFNLADAWIVAGVAGLMYDSLVSSRRD